MKMLLILVCSSIVILQSPMLRAQSATTGEIKGKVLDILTQEVIPRATLRVKGTQFGTVANAKGEYTIVNLPAGSYTLVVSYTGFESVTKSVVVTAGQTAIEDFSLIEASLRLEDLIIVTASKKAEKITDAPTTIQAVQSKQLEQAPLIGGFEAALAGFKGIDYLRTGVTGGRLAARGFNGAFNTKLLYIIDGRISVLPSFGLALGVNGTGIKEDMDRIEVVLGPESSVYGPNAHNLTVNMITKDPRTSEGAEIVVGAGTQNLINVRGRYAQKINDQWAFKISGEYLAARDFEYIDSVYGISVNGLNFAYPERSGRFDSAGTRFRTPFTTNIFTGVGEYSPDLNIRQIKAEGSVYFTPVEKTDIILSGGFSNSRMPRVVNPGRFTEDWSYNFVQARLVSPNWYVSLYNAANNARVLPLYNQTRLLNRSPVPGTWFRRDGDPTNRDQLIALTTQRVLAGDVRPEEAAQAVTFFELSQQSVAEVQYNTKFEGFTILAGLNWIQDRPRSNGTFYRDTVVSSRDINAEPTQIQPINQFGGSVYLERDIVAGFRGVAAARLDWHSVFGFQFNPKFALVFNGWSPGTFRVTYARSFAAPTSGNQQNLFLPNGTLFNRPSFVRGNSDGFTMSDGTTFDPIRPEVLQTLELGFKGSVTRELYVDVNGYYSWQSNFISPNLIIGSGPTTQNPQGVYVVKIGNTSIPGGEYPATFINFGQTNVFGVDVSLNWLISNNFSIGFNYSFFGSNFDSTARKSDGSLVWDSNRDGRVAPNEIALNTPANKASMIANFTDVLGSGIGGYLQARFVQAYDFVSGSNYAVADGREGTRGYVTRNPALPWNAASNPTVSVFNVNPGRLGGFVTVDVGLNYRFELWRGITLSAVVTNLLGVRQIEMTSSAPIGRMIVGEAKFAF